MARFLDIYGPHGVRIFGRIFGFSIFPSVSPDFGLPISGIIGNTPAMLPPALVRVVEPIRGPIP